MQWCRFQAGQKIAYGIIEDDTVIEVTGESIRELYQDVDHLSVERALNCSCR